MYFLVNVVVLFYYLLDGLLFISFEVGQMVICMDRWLLKKDCSKIFEGNSKFVDLNGEFVWEFRVWVG